MKKQHWILVLLMFIGSSASVQAGYFSYSAGFSDGTSFKVLYEDTADNTEDGFCSGAGCRLFDIIFDFGPGSVLGNYAANPANPYPDTYPNIYAVNLDDPLLNNSYSFSLTGLAGPFGGSFTLALSNPDPVLGTDSLSLSGGGPTFIYDDYCRHVSSAGPRAGQCQAWGNGPLTAAISARSVGDLAELIEIENPFPDPVNAVPSPATWLLLLTGLLAVVLMRGQQRSRIDLATA